jgi:hypothetical protein
MLDPFGVRRRVTGQETHGYTLSGLGGKSVPGKLAFQRQTATHGQITERKLSVSQSSLFPRPACPQSLPFSTARPGFELVIELMIERIDPLREARTYYRNCELVKPCAPK